MRYKFATFYSKAYCEEKNEELLKKYMKIFRDENLNYGTTENFKRCLMFSGALLDEVMGHPEWKAEEMMNLRRDCQKKLKFSCDDMDVIEKNMDFLTEALKKEDPANKEHYDMVCDMSKDLLSEIYKQEKEERKNAKAL